MTDVPSNKNQRLVKVLGELSAKFANDPRARRISKAMDYEQDVAALVHCIGDGFENANHFDEHGVARASADHYKRLAREIVEFSLLYPEDAPETLVDCIWFIEVVSHGRTNALKERSGPV